MIVNKLEVVKLLGDEWLIDLNVKITKDMCEYWELETEEEVKDFVGFLLNRR